jgi:hypothetical protein
MLLEAGCQWLTTVIPAAQEAEIRRIVVQTQPGQIVRKTLSEKNLSQKRAGGVAQGVGPEFKSQYHKKRKRNAIGIFHIPIIFPLFFLLLTSGFTPLSSEKIVTMISIFLNLLRLVSWAPM